MWAEQIADAVGFFDDWGGFRHAVSTVRIDPGRPGVITVTANTGERLTLTITVELEPDPDPPQAA